jgi:hypothetical protein
MTCLASVIPNNVGNAEVLALFSVKEFLNGVNGNDFVLPRATGGLPFILDIVLFHFARDFWRVKLALLATAFRCVRSHGFRTALLGFLFLASGIGRAATDLLEVCIEYVGCRLTMLILARFYIE